MWSRDIRGRDWTGRILTDRVHGVRRELKDTIKDEIAALEEAVAPIPTVILYDIVRFSLHPEVERNEREASYPPDRSI